MDLAEGKCTDIRNTSKMPGYIWVKKELAWGREIYFPSWIAPAKESKCLKVGGQEVLFTSPFPIILVI